MIKSFRQLASGISLMLIGIILLTAVNLTATHIVSADAGVLYAAPTAQGSGDCTSWANACTLQTALTNAVNSDEIWVKEGVHLPGTNREDTFTLKSGVALYGGFDGTESSLDARDWQTNLTILSGDIDNNDTNTDGNYIAETAADIQESNAYHVVTGGGTDDTAVLDGFIITAGQATGSMNPQNVGGGMYNDSSSNPTLSNVIFIGNTATNYGGGLYNWESNPTLTNITFSGNAATDYGGGMANVQSSPTLTNVTFRGNTADYGGGMINSSAGNPTLTNVTFSGNTANSGGGGMANYNSSNPMLINVTFSGNAATDYGGGMYNDSSNPILTNVSFSGNTATNYGGGMYSNCSNPTLTNVILWGDSASIGPEIYNLNSPTTISYSDIQGCGGSGTWNSDFGTDGGGNIDADPLFVDDSTDNLRLQPNSPAVDAGNNAAVSPGVVTDLDGNPRFMDIPSIPDTGSGTPPIVDMGAYEAYEFLYAAPSAQGSGDCFSWVNACTLQTALTHAINGDEIWVKSGAHYPTSDSTDPTATFTLKNGVALYGGFAGIESSLDQRDWQTNLTILSGDIDNNDTNTDGNCIAETAANIQGSNAYHVITGGGTDNTAVLDGFIVTAGQANGTSSNDCGGGVYNDSSSPSLTNIIFIGNTATYGGGMHNLESDPTMTNIIFSRNTATVDGGGMSNAFSNPTLTNANFSRNSAGLRGGGMYNSSSSPTLTNVIIWGNIGSEISNDINAPIIAYSDIRGCGGSGSWNSACGTNGGGNIDVNPLFYDLDNGNLRLQLTSPAIDAGNNAAVPPSVVTDLDGKPRFMDIPSVPDTGSGTPPIVDMGAYETYKILYAAPLAQGSGNCLSWANACTLQTALGTAISDNEIWVKAGTHYPTSDSSDRSASFNLKIGVTLYGGFAGTESSRDQRNLQTNLTILSGDIDNNDTNLDLNNIAEASADIQGNNAYHVIISSGTGDSAVLDGFIVTAGQANGASFPDYMGGGMYNYCGGPTVTNVTFSGNTASGDGGGMENRASSPTLTNVTFSGNAASYGGGINNSSSSAKLTNVTFSGNTANSGGGLYNGYSSVTLTNITFSGNSSSQGGGMFNWYSSPMLTNIIMWGDSGSEISNYSSTPSIAYSDIQGCGRSDSWSGACGTDAGGNIDADPLFVDATSGNLRLQLTSPAIDAGNNESVPVGITTDLDGNPRFMDIPSVPDTGSGTPPIVDMGAYEFQFKLIFLPLIVK